MAEDQAPRYRFWSADLTGPSAELEAAEVHHALHVLRLKVGEAVELFDGQGRRAAGRLVQARRDRATVALERVEGPAERPRPWVHLAFAVPKGKRLDWLLEKAAELGAASLQPLRCARSVADPDRPGPRWTAICASAVRQSRQTHLSDLLPPAPVAEVVAQGPRGRGVIAHADAEPLRVVLADHPPEVQVLVGPEGGWTDDELAAARQAGFTPARVGSTVLRVETAAVALLAGVATLTGA